MVSVNTNLNNYSYWEILHEIFEGYSAEFVYTATGIFRQAVPPLCPKCCTQMNHNGYNTYEKRGLGSVKIGRYICPCCYEPCEEERSFWENLKGDFFDVIGRMYNIMKLHHVSYQGISDIMELIYPQGKDTILNMFADTVEETVIPPLEDF